MNPILNAIAADPNVAPEFADVIGTMILTDEELMAEIYYQSGTVSFYEAADGSYSSEVAPRNAAKSRLRALRSQAEARGLGVAVSEMIRAGGYLTAP